MRDLFNDITEGLLAKGWKVWGGNHNTFLILNKDREFIKVYADNYEHPNHFIVRYSVREDQCEK